MAAYIGTSGWSYDHWVGILYLKSASSLERLDAYARHFRTVEVNNTFYRWPKDEVFTTWRERLPEGFVVSAKASRGVTLYQLPPHFPNNLDRLDRFLSVVPSGHQVAVEFRHPTWNVEDTFAV